MKQIFFYFSLLLLFVSCTNNNDFEGNSELSPALTKGLFDNVVTIQWTQEGQLIDGFGIAEADCATQVFQHEQRDTIMSLLFGDNGLKISMLRGEVFPHYWENETDSTFGTDFNVNIPLSDPYFQSADADELRRTGQLWVTKKAKELYNVDKLFFSTWSPPAFMKSNNNASHGSLKAEYYQKFAEYLAGFCKAYGNIGLDVYAISPVNEPNYEADWNSCKWSEQELADFIANNMGPTFANQGVSSKIIFGELAQWSTLVLGALNLVSAKKYVENVMAANPNMLNYASIAAGHGYNIPNISYEFPIVEYDKAVENGLDVWLTEISSALDTYDDSMDNAMHWAEVFYKYLSNAKVNAICWWAGARYTDTNESMIRLVDNSYLVPKRFYTYGNYTRYIKVGSKRVDINKSLGVSGDLLVSSFKKDNEYVVVGVNKSTNAVSTTLKIEGSTSTGNLQCYTTDENSNWQQSLVNRNSDGSYSLTLPARSVVTFVGEVE